MPKALIFGGTGQIGSAIAEKLTAQGWHAAIVSRRQKVAPDYSFTRSDVALDQALAGCDAVVNCIGILAPSGNDTFDAIHHALPAQLAARAAKNQIRHFIHISALGADKKSPSAYARSKADGEAAVKKAFPDAIIFRPSIVFGPRDHFFNRFASMARFSPFLPLIGGGHSRFQPVYVGDVAHAVMAALARTDARGQIFTLGGPDVYCFKELMAFILKTTGLRRFLLPMPWWVAALQAAVLEKLPGKILTSDQLKLLRTDNVVPADAPGLAALGITPTSIEAVVPGYLRP